MPVLGRWATRSAIAAHGPSPGRAALATRRSRSNFLPTSRSAPREPAPESSLLGRSRPRAIARRPSRRSMCGRACTPRTRAAARALTGAGSRLAAWPARPFKFLSHSAAAKRAQSADWHVARGRSASPRRRSWPPARAQRPRHSRSASRRRSASERANSHCAEIQVRRLNDFRPTAGKRRGGPPRPSCETTASTPAAAVENFLRCCAPLQSSVCLCMLQPSYLSCRKIHVVRKNALESARRCVSKDVALQVGDASDKVFRA